MTTYARLPERMRIIELARRLDVPAAELQKRLTRLDIAAPTVLTSIARSEIRLVLEDYRVGDSNGSNAPDPELIDELLNSIGPSPLSRINDAGVTGDNEFVAHFRREDDDDPEVGYRGDLRPGREDLTVQIEPDVEQSRSDVENLSPAETVEHEQLPERMRIFELGKRLDVPAAELQKRLTRLGVDAKSVLKGIDRSDMRLVLEDYKTGDVDGANAPDPALVDELLRSLGTPPATGADDSVDDADGTDVTVELENEPEQVEPEPVPDNVVDLSDAEKPDDQAPIIVADTAPVLEDHGTEIPETQIDLGPDDSSIDDASSDELQEGEQSEVVLDRSRDDVLQAALAQAGVVEADVVVEHEVVDEVDVAVTGTELPHASSSRRRGLKARTRIITVGIGILVGTMVLATVYAMLRPTYAAESEIVITISGLGGEEIQRELQSFAVVASSQTVLAPVAEEFGISVPEIREAFAPEIVGDSTVLRFTTTGSTPEDALALNEAITASYLAVANDPLDQSQLAFVTDRIDLVTEQIADLDAELSDVELAEAANASTRLRIESERNIAQAQLADLQGLLVDLRASGAAPAGSVTFVEGQINATETRLDELVTEAQALESEDAGVRSTVQRLRDDRSVLRAELADLQELQVQIEFDQVAGNRVAVLAAGHPTDDAVGLTPMRAIVLGLLVGGALAFAWVVAATQLRKRQ